MMFVNSFTDKIPPAVAEVFNAISQELIVLGVFLVSYVTWRHLGMLKRRFNAERKLKLNDPIPYQKKPFTSGFKTAETPAKLGNFVADSNTKALEAQMMRHLEQHEFTRALNLYRSTERGDGCRRNFSEQFYVAFIESAVRVGKTDVLERLFRALKRSDLTPSQEFWRRVLKMLSSRKHFSTCLLVHTLFRHQLPVDKVVWSCLANASLEVGDAQRAASMLEQYTKADISIKDHVLLFRTYLALKDVESAEALFHKLGGQTSPLMLNLLLLTCVNTGQPERGLRLLHEAHELEDKKAGEDTTVVDIISYNTVIKGLAQAGVLKSCFECLRGMVSRGLQPDDITFATLLDACIKENDMGAIGEIVKMSMDGEHQVGTVMYTLFIKGLVKADCLPKALELCDEMKRKAGAMPDVITYSVLIKALVDRHDLERALQLVQDMGTAGHVPDDIILTHLLEGCRYAGNHSLGKKLFAEFVALGVKPSEFTLLAMLKLCGHVGAHQEAHDLVAGWEGSVGDKPSVIHYTCLMSGSLRRKHYDLAWAAFELMKANGVKPDTTTFSTLLPGMVAAHGWDRILTIAREALALPLQHKIPPETLNNALAQMQAAEGFAGHAAEFQELMRAAGVTLSARRSQPERLVTVRR